MQWFTSDLHFAHPHVAKLRGFDDYKEHDRQIIRNLNELVAPDDDLYVLGDISSGSKTSLNEALSLLHRLNVGRTHRVLILGNHDSTRLEAGKLRKFITEFGQVAMRGSACVPGLGNVLLSHYPYADYLDDRPADGLSTNATSSRFQHLAIPDNGRSVLLHGHTHATIPDEFPDPRQCNVGLDAWKMRPVNENALAMVFVNNGEYTRRTGWHVNVFTPDTV